MKNTGIILLAAGGSSRMGSPKQLLLFEGKTLLEKIIDISLNVFEKENIILVLGSEHEKIESSIQGKNISICINTNWKSGMASSINLGLKTLLLKFSEMEKCFISVCDQPYLNSDVFVEMINIFKTSKKEIAVAKYAETLGVPALFSKKYFEELIQLQGEQGAKKIILQNSDDVAVFEFEKGAIDIDTPSDYDNLKLNK
ncbi:nucleotidyltransferase family protein [Chryseobacterium culicis]|uniref:Molybdenum cofactor cytidylyltransferase n=1 Tax=Chryseobacterium culicis TaxID=680127 RepID=A0A1H6IG52_CHRCI|nr:nucleotidyltransferase family protein [Chryseobacterium culicis]SEH47748.1 molybdenum cofactor cytidylyltransferase [Chryseobacterium culicis]